MPKGLKTFIAWRVAGSSKKNVHQRFDRFVPDDLRIREARELLDEFEPNESAARSRA